MMTDACNLRCPYCFANEFVNTAKNEISEQAFDYATEFILGDGTHHSVGLIGGEPTIHSDFDYLVRKLIRDDRAKDIIIYTNGINIDLYWDIITHKKVHLLINCNSPADIGQKNYRKLCDNLDVLLLQKEFTDNVTLGINMYKFDFEYDYILELLKKYGYHHVRVSITVPNVDEKRNVDAHTYFNTMKPRMLQFFTELFQNGIVPNFDCNKIPSCLVTDTEILALKQYAEDPVIAQNIAESNVATKLVKCVPVIDIRQDLTAVRCFGLSEWTKQDIRDFKGIKDLENYYLSTVDAFAYSTAYSDKCGDCYLRKTLQCSGGCFAFKINEILNLSRYAADRLGRREKD